MFSVLLQYNILWSYIGHYTLTYSRTHRKTAAAAVNRLDYA